MKIIFFGSSDFSMKALEACLESGHEVVLIITTPDKKKGRGLVMQPTPVRLFAEERQLPCEMPETLKDEALLEKIKALTPDLFVVSSYGLFIPSTWLTVPAKYALNVHPSILPRYRGAAPINWPILNGDSETGVSVAEVTHRLDAGDIFHQIRIPLDPDWDSEVLNGKLAELSYQVVAFVLRQIGKGTELRIPQSDITSSYARKLTKEDGHIDWSKPAEEIHRQIRGLVPWPRAYTFDQKKQILILKARCGNKTESAGKPGEIKEISKDGFIRVQTGKGHLLIDRLRPEGRKEMSGADYANGKRLTAGYCLGQS
ncbi:MAG: methionyl-tRNA formyltransferase [Candidatus Omnitrophica bacterium]|nr:methionyl-tRNA formyltransferase [Candidatus Omnitrophota bacterium]